MNHLRLSFLVPLLAFATLVIIGGVALYSTLSGSRDPTQLPSVLVGRLAPQTVLPPLRYQRVTDGADIKLANFQGQPLLINFFASWCTPCRAEAPALKMLSADIAILGIAYKDRFEDTEKFIEQFGNPFQAIGMDKDGRIGLEWGVYGVPETYLLDADGVIVLRHAGPLTRKIIVNTLMPALKNLKS